VKVAWPRFLRTGLVTALACLAAATATLVLTG